MNIINKRKAQIWEEFCKISSGYIDLNILHIIEEYDFTFKGIIENKWKFDKRFYSVDHLEIFPDGKIASTSNADMEEWSKIKIFNQDGKIYKEFLESSICFSIFALSNNLLLSATCDKLSMWNLEMQARYSIEKYETDEPTIITCMALLDNKIVTGDTSGILKIFMQSGECIKTWKHSIEKDDSNKKYTYYEMRNLRNSRKIICLIVLLDGRLISSSQKTFTIWSLDFFNSEDFPNKRPCFDNQLRSNLNISNKHKYFLGCGDHSLFLLSNSQIVKIFDCKVGVWNVETNNCEFEIQGPVPCHSSQACLIADGRLVVAGPSSALILFNLDTRTSQIIYDPREEPEPYQPYITSIKALPDHQLVTGNNEGIITIWS